MHKEQNLHSEVNSITQVQKLLRPVRQNINQVTTAKKDVGLYIKKLTPKNCIAKCKGIVQVNNQTIQNTSNDKMSLTEEEYCNDETKNDNMLKKVVNNQTGSCPKLNVKNANYLIKPVTPNLFNKYDETRHESPNSRWISTGDNTTIINPKERIEKTMRPPNERGFIDHFSQISKINFKKDFSAIVDTMNYKTQISEPSFLSSNLCRINSNNMLSDIQNPVKNNELRTPNKFSLQNMRTSPNLHKNKVSLGSKFMLESLMSSTDIHQLRSNTESRDFINKESYQQKYIESPYSERSKTKLIIDYHSLEKIPDTIQSFNARNPSNFSNTFNISTNLGFEIATKKKENPMKDLLHTKGRTFLKDFKMNMTSKSEMYNMNTFMSNQKLIRKRPDIDLFNNTYQVPFFLTPNGKEVNEFYKKKSIKTTNNFFEEQHKTAFHKKNVSSVSSLHKSQHTKSKSGSFRINNNSLQKIPSLKRLESAELKSISKKSISVDIDKEQTKPKKSQQKEAIPKHFQKKQKKGLNQSPKKMVTCSEQKFDDEFNEFLKIRNLGASPNKKSSKNTRFNSNTELQISNTKENNLKIIDYKIYDEISEKTDSSMLDDQAIFEMKRNIHYEESKRCLNLRSNIDCDMKSSMEGYSENIDTFASKMEIKSKKNPSARKSKRNIFKKGNKSNFSESSRSQSPNSIKMQNNVKFTPSKFKKEKSQFLDTGVKDDYSYGKNLNIQSKSKFLTASSKLISAFKGHETQNIFQSNRIILNNSKDKIGQGSILEQTIKGQSQRVVQKMDIIEDKANRQSMWDTIGKNFMEKTSEYGQINGLTTILASCATPLNFWQKLFKKDTGNDIIRELKTNHNPIVEKSKRRISVVHPNINSDVQDENKNFGDIYSLKPALITKDSTRNNIYISHWMKCIDKALDSENFVDVNEIGYYSFYEKEEIEKQCKINELEKNVFCSDKDFRDLLEYQNFLDNQNQFEENMLIYFKIDIDTISEAQRLDCHDYQDDELEHNKYHPIDFLNAEEVLKASILLDQIELNNALRSPKKRQIKIEVK